MAAFVYDSRFAQSAAMAGDWNRQHAIILDAQSRDLGQFWRTRIHDLLARGGVIAGATLWSDQYICEMFGRECGLKRGPFTQLDGELCSWLLF